MSLESGSYFRFVNDSCPADAHACWIQFPPIMCIGWIPDYDADSIPAGQMRTHWADEPLIPLVFESGNPEPPKKFSGSGGVAEYLHSQEYRVALALDEVKLYMNTQGQVSGVTWWELAKAGYTPLRLTDKYRVKWPGQMKDGGRKVTLAETGVSLERKVYARPGQPLPTGARLMTGQKMSWVCLQVRYELSPAGQFYALVRSSAVPSLSVYFRWQSVALYEMEKAPFPEFKRYAESGERGEKHAPLFDRWTTSGKEPMAAAEPADASST